MECNTNGGCQDARKHHTRDFVDIPFKLPNRLFGKNDKIRLKCIDCHAGGEPARVVLSGVPSLPQRCTTALSKRSYMMEHYDYLRKILLLEPRGYPCQNVNFIFPPSPTLNDNADPSTMMQNHLQYVIGEQQKIYPLMSGHNTICVATALLECGVIPMQEPSTDFVLEAPAGLIEITAKCNRGKVESVALTNAPSFVEHLDVPVVLPNKCGAGLGGVIVKVDVAYGCMWYCIVDLKQFQSAEHQTNDCSKLRLNPACGKELCRIGEIIKAACREQYPVQHPTEDYPGCDILAFRDTSQEQHVNAVIMSNNVLDWDRPETWTAMIDRSPCGTGTCAIMATLHSRGLLGMGDNFDHYSIVGSKFTGTIVNETIMDDGRVAILPKIEGSAYITQYSEVVVDRECDPFPEGYKVADIW